MKNWINTHKPLAIGIVAAILAIVIALVLIVGGKGKDEEKNTENIGTEISTETGENTENDATEETDGTEDDKGNSDEGDTENDTTENAENAGTVTSDSGNTQEETQTPVTPSVPTYTYTEMNKTMYVISSVNIRNLPSVEGNLLGTLPKGFEAKVTGQCKETNWYRIEVTGGGIAYVSNNYLSDTKPVEETTSTPSTPSTDSNKKYFTSHADLLAAYPEGTTYTGVTADFDPSTSWYDMWPDHTYINVNGFTLDVTDKSDEGIAFAREMAEAGYYNPVYHNGEYHMLIKGTDNHQEWVSWLYDYIKERGGIPNGGGGNNFCDTGDAYKIYVKVTEIE